MEPVILVVALVVVGLCFYFLPAVVARNRRHRDAGAIFVLNLLAGWTFLGWVGALAWSLSSNVESPHERQ